MITNAITRSSHVTQTPDTGNSCLITWIWSLKLRNNFSRFSFVFLSSFHIEFTHDWLPVWPHITSFSHVKLPTPQQSPVIITICCNIENSAFLSHRVCIEGGAKVIWQWKFNNKQAASSDFCAQLLGLLERWKRIDMMYRNVGNQLTTYAA
jgi:hypothetical protein